MPGANLSEKEAALIAAAKRELAVHASPAAAGQANAPVPGAATTPARAPIPTPPEAARPPDKITPGKPDVAARIALLMAAEQEEKLRRTKRLRQIGIGIPAVILGAAILWVVAAILRHLRS